MSSFFSELKRRKVIRAVVAYAIAAFVVIQAADPLVDLLMLPEWTLRMVFALAILGLPVVVGLAWAFDWGPGGLKSAAGGEVVKAQPAVEAAPSTMAGGRDGADAPQPSRIPTPWRIAVGGAVLVLALAAGAFTVWGGSEAELEGERVLVLPLENATGDATLDVLGRMAADWILQGLVTASLGEVVPLSDAEQLLDDLEGSPSRPPVPTLARAAGAGLVVTGSIYRRGDSLEIQARVMDGRGGRVLDAIPAQSAPAADPIAAVEGLQRATLGLLASRLDRPETSTTTLAEQGERAPSLEAYRKYRQGMEHFGAQEYAEAIRFMSQAYATDTAWLAPLSRQVLMHQSIGDLAAADSLIRFLRPRRSRLVPNSRLLLDLLEAHMRGDVPGALAAARERFEAGLTYFTYVNELYKSNYPGQAVELLDTLDPQGEVYQEWTGWYSDVHTGSLHVLENHGRELEVALQARELYPDQPRARYWHARALAALHRPDEAADVLDGGMTLPPRRGWSPGDVQVLGGLELRRHGHIQAGDEALRKALAWYRSAEGDHRYPMARAHLWLGVLDQAIPLFEELVLESTDNVHYNGYLGLAKARSGDHAGALEADRRLAAWSDPYVRGSNLLWRAAIVSELGELDQAMAHLRNALAAGVDYRWLHENEDLRALRDHEPFIRLIEPKG